MPESAVSDTGPILHLAEIGKLELLFVFDAVAIPEQVRSELRRYGRIWPPNPSFLKLISIERVSRAELRTQEFALPDCRTHKADLSTAALASKLKPDVVLTDDLRLRKGIEAQGHVVVGSVGVLVRALRTGLLGRPAFDEALDQLLDDSSLYTSKVFRERVRRLIEHAEDGVDTT